VSKTWANPEAAAATAGPRSWVSYGIDLHLDLAGSRVRAGLEAALRDAVRTGRLAPGRRLPSSRDLATDLSIARNTVADAYGQLVAEGWLEARTGAGTWVADRPAHVAHLPRRPAARPVKQRYDLRAGVPAGSAFPRRAWLAAARAALNSADDSVLGYPDPRGLRQLRRALAEYLGRARGVVAGPDNVVICAGFAHGLALVCQVLGARGGTTLGIEAYGHLLHRRITAANGMRPVAVPVDERGAAPTGLDVPGDLATASGLVLTPAHQFPLGMTLAPPRRTAFVRWATRTGGVIIEDDYDGEYRFDRQPVGAMQALAPGYFIYAGTASKNLAPALRLGWLVVPDAMIDEMLAIKESSGCINGALDQLTLARFIESGGYDRQIRQSRLMYRRRRDRLIAALHRQAPAVRLAGIAAGLHALAELPDTESESDAIARAARHGVAVDGLAAYTAPGHERGPALVVGYGRPADHAFTTAVGRLCAALADSDQP
jgi:GntR family transcriptional regulator/MocR family aminotransferase